MSTGGPTGNLVRTIMLGVAEFEREMICQRTAEGMRAKIAKGEWHGGPLPLGYSNDKPNKKLIINIEEAPLVEHIFDLYLKTKSSGETVTQINSEGFRTQRGKEFTKKGILRITQNPVYCGKFKGMLDDGSVEYFDGLHEAIVDINTFKQAGAICAENNVNTYKNKVLPSELLFNSLLKCGHCDSFMTPHPTKKNNRKIYYYRCTNAVNRGAAVCDIGQIASADIELHGIVLLRLLSLDNRLLKSVLSQAKEDKSALNKDIVEHQKRLTKNRSEEKKKIDDLMNFLMRFPEDDLIAVKDKIIESQNTIASIDYNISQLEKELVRNKQPIDDMPFLKSDYEYFWYIWRSLKFEDRRKAMRLIIKEIKLNSAGVKDGNKLYNLEIELVTNTIE